MTNERSPEQRRLSKFSNANPGNYRQPLPERNAEHSDLPLSAEDDPPLAELLEHAIRDGTLAVPSGPEDAGEALPSKLIEELRASQDQFRGESQEHMIGEEMRAALGEVRVDRSTRDPTIQASGELVQVLAPRPRKFFARVFQSADPRPAPSPNGPVAARIGHALRTVGASGARGAKTLLRRSGQLSRRMRPRDWKRRYFALLSLIHRHGFDRGTEKLLFSKTPALRLYRVTENAAAPQKTFHYEGPIPLKVLDWALSALPSDLKRYAFVDFRAGNGRTLLLAARRNFEFACGYAYDPESCEILEMNLAQYPRSYMSCRDVRALRGDRDGIAIPSQPAVLFLPDSLSAIHRDIVLSHVSASYRLNPRSLYIIVDNAGKERRLDHMEIFERVPIPIYNRVKAIPFSPAKVEVYRTLKMESVD